MPDFVQREMDDGVMDVLLARGRVEQAPGLQDTPSERPLLQNSLGVVAVSEGRSRNARPGSGAEVRPATPSGLAREKGFERDRPQKGRPARERP